jgi:hypothetical protein
VVTGLLPKNNDLIHEIETASKVLCHIKSKPNVPISWFLII